MELLNCVIPTVLFANKPVWSIAHMKFFSGIMLNLSFLQTFEIANNFSLYDCYVNVQCLHVAFGKQQIGMSDIQNGGLMFSNFADLEGWRYGIARYGS